MRLERSFSSKTPGGINLKCGSYTLALVGSRQVKRDEERVKTHGGRTVLEGKANYAQCHVPPPFYGVGLERAWAFGDWYRRFQSIRSLDETYRTSLLRGLFAHMKRGFYHDGRFARASVDLCA